MPAAAAGAPATRPPISTPRVSSSLRPRPVRTTARGLHTNPAARHLPVTQDGLRYLLGHVHRDGKAQPNTAAAARKDGRVDANEPPVGIDRAARLPGLMAASVWMKFSKVLMPSWLRPSALTMPEVTVWAHAERVANREHRVAHLQGAHIAERDHGQLVELDAQHRDVGPGRRRPGWRGLAYHPTAAPRCPTRQRPHGCWSAAHHRPR